MSIKEIIELLEKIEKKEPEVEQKSKSDCAYVYPWMIGKHYFIRTVTMHVCGKLIDVTDKELVLRDCSWVADSGRFHDALKTGELNEVEPFIDDVIVNRNSVIDATLWRHLLPNSQK